MQNSTNTTENKTQSVDIQNVIQQLLAQGLSIVQVWSKISLCKSLFKKGTPEFYACLGIKPPPSAYQRPQPQPKPQPKTQQQQKPTVVIKEGVSNFAENHKTLLLLAGISAVALIILLAKRR